MSGVRRLLVQTGDRVMSRHFVALAILALAGTALVLPEASARSFGFSGGARLGGFRAPFAAQRITRPGPSHRVPGAYAAILQRPPFVGPGSRPAARSVAHGLGRDIAPDLRARFVRQHHRGSIAGYVFPFTSEGYGDAPYLGTPYDPAEAIPVYAPPSVYQVPPDDQDATPPSRRLVPRQTGLREENQEACRSERVTVPETSGEGEREILVVRC
jgi:hypothetical protein